jgi:multiple sugar transport system substrate-binding protein
MKLSRRRFTRVAAAAVVATLGLTLAACSSDGGSSSDKVTITYGLWADNFEPSFNAAIKAFEKENPNITVQLKLTPFNDYFTKLNTEIASKTAPDIFWLQNIHINLYAKNGALADLESYKKDSKVDLSGIPSSVLKPYEIGGKLYAMPWQALPFGLYYNKKLFADAGVAVPTNTWTWDDVATAAKQLTKADKSVYGIAAPVWNYGTFYQSMYGYGADVITKNGTDTDVDSAAAQKGLSVWTDLVKDGYSPTVAQTTDTPADSWFSSGKTAMITSGPWTAASYAKGVGETNLGLVAMPTGSVKQSGYATTVSAVSASSSHTAQAYKFAEFLSSDEGQKILASVADGVAGAPVNSHADAAWVKATPKIGMQNILDELPAAKLLPSSDNTAAWENQEATILSPAYTGESSVADVSDAMAKAIKASLAKEK